MREGKKMKRKFNDGNHGETWTDFQISGNIIKLFHHKEFVEQRKRPISCQFILTNRCNLKCEFCCNKHRDQSLIMDTKTARKALEDLKQLGCKGVEFTGGSEPTMHKDFYSILEKCLELGMTPSLVTNGVLLSEIPRELLKRLDWLRISINASREHYKAVHGYDFYDKVMEGIKYISDLPISNKGVSYIFYNKTTFDDVQKLIDELQGFNLDYFRFSLDVFNNPKITSMNIKPEFESKNIKIIYHCDRDTRVPNKCRIFYYKPVLDCSGLIYPCCTNQHKEILPLGKVKDLLKIWEDKNIELDTSKCVYCIYGEANDLIVNLEENKLKNLNFI